MTERIPSIGGARGIFEIFIPGLFVLLNLCAALYLLPFTDDATKGFLTSLASGPALGLLLVVPFGYLSGVVLRLFRTDVPDRASAGFQRLFWVRGGRRDQTEFAYAPFPYIAWLAYLIGQRFPAEATSFFSNVWKPHPNKEFVNFCKVVVSSADSAAAGEIYAAESLSRYISGMFYSLCLALLMLATVVISRWVVGLPIAIGFGVLGGSYLLGILTILANFRFIRIKEVETIFAATYKNRQLFPCEQAQPEPSNPPMQPTGSAGG